MFRNIKMYLRFSAQNVRALMEFKNDFVVSTVAGAVMQTVGLIFLFVLFGNISSIGGWSLYEVALLYACMMISEGMLTLLFQGTSSLTYYVRTGNFDRFLLRPLDVTVQILGSQINFAGLGTVVTGIAVIVVSLYKLDTPISLGLILLFVVNIVFGVCIRVNLNLATTSLAFWLIATGGLSTMVYNTQDFGKYPLSIYPTVIRVVLLTVIPHAMISYVPTCLILGKLSVLPWIFAVPASMIFMIFLRKFIYSHALKRYESAGN